MAVSEGDRPPAYNPAFGRSHDAASDLYPAVTELSPPAYGNGVNDGNVSRPRQRYDSLPSRSRRSRPALSNVCSNKEVPMSTTAPGANNFSEEAKDHDNDKRRRCHSVGRRPRRRFQFDTIGRDQGRQVVHTANAAPMPPPRQLPGEPVGSPIKCLRRFDVYSHSDVESRGYHALTAIHVSDSGNILVVDSHSMLVHVFSSRGAHLCPAFKVLGVCGGCFWKENKLVLATHRGLKICHFDGSVEADIVIGPVICTKQYRQKFIAVQRQCFTIYDGLRHKITADNKIAKVCSGSLIKHRKSFVEIADVAVTNGTFVVLDIGRNIIYKIDERGRKISKVVLDVHMCGSIQLAHGIVVDNQNNIIVCARSSKQLLKFQANGKYICCLLNLSVKLAGVDVDGVPLLHGIAVNSLGQLCVTLSGNDMAEIRVYRF